MWASCTGRAPGGVAGGRWAVAGGRLLGGSLLFCMVEPFQSISHHFPISRITFNPYTSFGVGISGRLAEVWEIWNKSFTILSHSVLLFRYGKFLNATKTLFNPTETTKTDSGEVLCVLFFPGPQEQEPIILNMPKENPQQPETCCVFLVIYVTNHQASC